MDQLTVRERRQPRSRAQRVKQLVTRGWQMTIQRPYHPAKEPGLIATNDGPCMCLLNRDLFLLVLSCVDDIILVVDCQNFLSIHADLHNGLVSLRKPETADLLVLTHEVGTLDPKRGPLRGMPFDPYYGVVVNINPQFALKQILILSVRNCLGYETTVWPHLLFAEQIQRIVFRRDGAIMMLLSGCGLDLAGDKLIQRHSTNDPRS